jgi:hypothetical protein
MLPFASELLNNGALRLTSTQNTNAIAIVFSEYMILNSFIQAKIIGIWLD